MTAYSQHSNSRYNKRNIKDRANAPKRRHIDLESAGWDVGLDDGFNIQHTYTWLDITVRTWMSFSGQRKIALLPDNPDYNGPLFEIANSNAIEITTRARELICQVLADLYGSEPDTSDDSWLLAGLPRRGASC